MTINLNIFSSPNTVSNISRDVTKDEPQQQQQQHIIESFGLQNLWATIAPSNYDKTSAKKRVRFANCLPRKDDSDYDAIQSPLYTLNEKMISDLWYTTEDFRHNAKECYGARPTFTEQVFLKALFRHCNQETVDLETLLKLRTTQQMISRGSRSEYRGLELINSTAAYQLRKLHTKAVLASDDDGNVSPDFLAEITSKTNRTSRLIGQVLALI